MMAKDKFKLGFATELAQRGIAPQRIATFIKHADGMLKDLYNISDVQLQRLLNALKVAVPTTFGVVGWGLGRGHRVSENDLKAMRDQALMEEYSAAIQQLKAQQQWPKDDTAFRRS